MSIRPDSIDSGAETSARPGTETSAGPGAETSAGPGADTIAGSQRVTDIERRAIIVSGVVQGVGFRPFVFELAKTQSLAGFVQNKSGSVRIEVEGRAAAIDAFVRGLVERPPPLALVEHVQCFPQPPQGAAQFVIIASDARTPSEVFVSPDVATCEACLDELFDPADRRYRYPFINCTHCGPRLTIVRDVPYDRERTTMAGFEMCEACRAEYECPTDRRFHAQPIACPACGPRLDALDRDGKRMTVEDPLAFTVAGLCSGQIVAIKGLGGFHLACDATSADAVSELRRRKHRDEKPLAVMVADLATVARLCILSADEQVLLESRARPIVLLRRRPGGAVADSVAPGNPHLGMMLPYAPLHHLLLRDLAGLPLVMTSGNLSDDPIAFEDRDAIRRLGPIADFVLTNNRPIHLRCDDSVARIVAGGRLPLRRSRGYVPEPLTMPVACDRGSLAVGGQLKSAFALGRERHAFLSHHLGDLDHFAAYQSFETAIEHYERLFAHRSELIAHDLHPDYGSTRYALARAQGTGIETLAVQHHHAHLASCMADNGLTQPVIGVTFDGTGYGPDGAIWGGEFLIGDYRGYRRAAHLRYVPMPGGERAIYEPWRMALSHLLDAGEDPSVLLGCASPESLRTVEKMIERGLNAPPTSSAGRLFDAIAAIAGVRDRVTWEGQAAVELEWLAERSISDGTYPFELAGAGAVENGFEKLEIDVRPLIAAVVNDRRRRATAAAIARRFHRTLVELIAEVCSKLRDASGLNDVVLSGGVFMNALLLNETLSRLSQEGFVVYRHRQVPPNDGGLALGQLAIAATYNRK